MNDDDDDVWREMTQKRRYGQFMYEKGEKTVANGGGRVE